VEKNDVTNSGCHDYRWFFYAAGGSGAMGGPSCYSVNNAAKQTRPGAGPDPSHHRLLESLANCVPARTFGSRGTYFITFRSE